MFRNVFLIDITEHRGLEQSIIISAQAHASEFAPELVEWFKTTAQTQPEFDSRGKVFTVLDTGLQLWPQIRQRILELSTNGQRGSVFHVLSYDPYILAEARKLNRPDMIIRTTPLAVLLTKYKPSARGLRISDHRTPASRMQIGLESGSRLPIAQSLEITKQVLKKRGHVSKQTALLQVQLRPLLVQEDPRMKKDKFDPTSTRLVAHIVNEGLRLGCIGRYDIESIPGTERIYLIENEPISLHPDLTPVQRDIGAERATTPPSRDASQRNGLEADGMERIGAQPVPLAEGEVDASEVAEKRSNDKGRVRTTQIIGVLKDAGIYSPKAQRDKLFRALRQCLLPGGSAKTLLQLSREIRHEASKSSDTEEVDFPYWHPATEGMIGMLLGAGVLRNDAGKRISDSPFARGSSVLSFDEPLEDLCEAFLLETVISQMKDITKHDRVPLAHALFWNPACSTRDQVEDRFEHIFKLLEDRLGESACGIWLVESRDKAKEASIG